jgi:hypothetical protein
MRPALTPSSLLPLAALKCVDDETWIGESIQTGVAQETSRYTPDFMQEAQRAPPSSSGPQPQAPPSPAVQQQPFSDGVQVIEQTLVDRRAGLKAAAASRRPLSTDLPAAKAAKTQQAAVTLSTELSDSQAGACVGL